MRTLCILLCAAPALAAHPFTFDDLVRARRIDSFDVSPDGRWVAYGLTTMNVDENRGTSAVWLQPVDGGEPRQLTSGRKHDGGPRFSPDGRRLAFTSDRDGAPQIYLLDLAGGEARVLSHLPGGADDLAWSPDGKFLVTASEVYPDCRDEKCNKERFDRKAPTSGRVVERLMFRHWDAWREGRRSHVFRVDAASGDALDLTPGDFDAPPIAGHGARGFDVSPDGKFVVFASNHERAEATSTNSDLFEVPAAGGAARPLTDGNRAFDGVPRYSPDGRAVAYLAQRIPGFESDRFELMVYDRDKRAARSLTAGFDGWVDSFAWAPDGKSLWFSSVAKARSPLYQIGLDGGAPREALAGLTAGEPTPLRDGSVLFTRVSLTRPVELWRFARGEATAVTHVNDALFAQVEMGAVRERWYPAGDGVKVHALVVLPPRFDEKKRWPALFVVHGGPQGAWTDGWTYRWNAQLFAAAGYVVYLPNPRGSTGYGQAFVRGVSGEWGGRTFDDLMRGADDLVSLPYVDGKRVGAAGASFGGYMINWFQGHTDRFRALFCHDGIADTESGYATEELWFPEFEFGGTPWVSPLYRKWNPIAAADRFKTPQLIVHGERDYRIPVEQAYLMFTALQRRGVPSKLLVFPDENHWVLKPANSRLWYATFQDWFHRYLGGAPADAKALESAASVTR